MEKKALLKAAYFISILYYNIDILGILSKHKERKNDVVSTRLTKDDVKRKYRVFLCQWVNNCYSTHFVLMCAVTSVK